MMLLWCWLAPACAPGVPEPADVEVAAPAEGAVLQVGAPYRAVARATHPALPPPDLELAWGLDGVALGNCPDRPGEDGSAGCDVTIPGEGEHELAVAARPPGGGWTVAAVAVTATADAAPVIESLSHPSPSYGPIYADVAYPLQVCARDERTPPEDLVVEWRWTDPDGEEDGVEAVGLTTALGEQVCQLFERAWPEGTRDFAVAVVDGDGNRTEASLDGLEIGPPNQVPACTIEEPASDSGGWTAIRRFEETTVVARVTDDRPGGSTATGSWTTRWSKRPSRCPARRPGRPSPSSSRPKGSTWSSCT